MEGADGRDIGRVNTRDAIGLIARAIPREPGIWADLGAGSGTFTRALAQLLGPGGRIYAVDRQAGVVSELARRGSIDRVEVIPVAADFSRAFELPGARATGLDGILLANALHFLPDAEAVLASLVGEWLRVGGRIVLVEYDRRTASRWVPYPIPVSRLPALATAAGLSALTVIATRPSAFSGILYAAMAERRTGNMVPSRPAPRERE